MSRPVDAVLIGAGLRGYYNYGRYAQEHPDAIRFVAVAELDEGKRQRFAHAHDIPEAFCFQTWEEMVARPQLAPVLINASNDGVHFASTMAGLETGYDVLLEKPIASTLAESVILVQTAARLQRSVWVTHTLRHTEFFQAVRRLVQSGRLGDVVTVKHSENVSWFRMAHSFVRGFYSNCETADPMILSKCCHDMDLLFWILGRRAVRLSSFGSLLHFRPDRAPHPEVPERCTDGCPVEDTCLYEARRLYTSDFMKRFVRHFTIDGDESSVLDALRSGPFGRCVYRCSNNVVDHQIVNLEFDGGISVNLIMQGHSHDDTRTMRYDGTMATLEGRFRSDITVHDHRPGKAAERIVPRSGGGHGGGDSAILETVVQAIRGQGPGLLSSAEEALESHMMAFAAEESRLNGGVVVDMEQYRQAARQLGTAT